MTILPTASGVACDVRHLFAVGIADGGLHGERGGCERRVARLPRWARRDGRASSGGCKKLADCARPRRGRGAGYYGFAAAAKAWPSSHAGGGGDTLGSPAG